MESSSPDYKKIKRNAKELYRTIGSVWCPGLNDRIYFNSAGFTHLEKKHGKWRSHAEQTERFSLLAHAPAVISNPSVKIVYSSQIKTLSAHFWALTTTINKKRIRVIIRQIGNGRKHFFSIFPKN